MDGQLSAKWEAQGMRSGARGGVATPQRKMVVKCGTTKELRLKEITWRYYQAAGHLFALHEGTRCSGGGDSCISTSARRQCCLDLGVVIVARGHRLCLGGGWRWLCTCICQARIVRPGSHPPAGPHMAWEEKDLCDAETPSR